MIGAKLKGDAETRTESPSVFFNRADLGGFSEIFKGIVTVGIITYTPAAVKIHVVINAGKKTNPYFFYLKGIPEKLYCGFHHQSGTME